MIDRDNYEILIDNGYYSEKEVEPDPTETPEPVTPTEAAEPTVTPTETPEEVSPTNSNGKGGADKEADFYAEANRYGDTNTDRKGKEIISKDTKIQPEQSIKTLFRLLFCALCDEFYCGR